MHADLRRSMPIIATSNEHKWPPREGRQFFFLWLGCALFGALASRAISFSISFSGSAGVGIRQYWLNVIPFIAIGLFEGWLLFTRGFRLLAWALLPVLHLPIPYMIARGVLRPSSISNAYGFASIGTIIIATLLLTGVRRRPWLWLFIQLAVLVVTQLLYAWLYASLSATVGFPALDRLASHLNGMLRLSAPLALSGSSIITSISSGIWLLGAILTAWALAFWMPPLRNRETQSGVNTNEPEPLTRP